MKTGKRLGEDGVFGLIRDLHMFYTGSLDCNCFYAEELILLGREVLNDWTKSLDFCKDFDDKVKELLCLALKDAELELQNYKKTMKYFFDQDDDCHWYLIPLDKKEEWDNLQENCDHELWNVFNQYRIDSPYHFTFEKPECI